MIWIRWPEEGLGRAVSLIEVCSWRREAECPFRSAQPKSAVHPNPADCHGDEPPLLPSEIGLMLRTQKRAAVSRHNLTLAAMRRSPQRRLALRRRARAGQYEAFLKELVRLGGALEILFHALLLHLVGVSEQAIDCYLTGGFSSHQVRSVLGECGLDLLEPKPRRVNPAGRMNAAEPVVAGIGLLATSELLTGTVR